MKTARIILALLVLSSASFGQIACSDGTMSARCSDHGGLAKDALHRWGARAALQRTTRVRRRGKRAAPARAGQSTT